MAGSHHRGSPAQLRILQVIDTLDVGGAERHVVDLSAALAARGHDVTIACSVGGPNAARLAGSGVRVRCLIERPVKRRLDLDFAMKLRALARDADIVHAHLHAGAAASALACRGSRARLVVTEHSEGQWRDVAAERAARRHLGRARRVIAVSRGVERRLVQRLGVPAESVTVIPNGIPGGGRAPPTATGNGRTVGVVARLVLEKGVDTFVRAAARLASQHPDVRFAIAGEGPLGHALEDQARRLGLGRRLCFLGGVAETDGFISGLDVLVVPSRTEGTPLVVLEAALRGRPIVATLVGGIPGQVRDGVEALLVQPEDPERFAIAVGRLLDDANLSSRIGAAAAERAATEFRHALMVDRVEAVYRQMLGGLDRSRGTCGKSNWSCHAVFKGAHDPPVAPNRP